jgi:hypothetical protein
MVQPYNSPEEEWRSWREPTQEEEDQKVEDREDQEEGQKAGAEEEEELGQEGGYSLEQLKEEWELAVIDCVPGLLLLASLGNLPRVSYSSKDIAGIDSAGGGAGEAVLRAKVKARRAQVREKAEVQVHKTTSTLLMLKIVYRSESTIGRQLRDWAATAMAGDGDSEVHRSRL